MSDIATFLRDRIDEEYLAATMLQDAYDRGEVRPPAQLKLIGALVEPGRVLARCAAMRELVELHEMGPLASGEVGCLYCQSDGELATEWIGPCTDLCILALPYDQHPDWNLGWSP